MGWNHQLGIDDDFNQKRKQYQNDRKKHNILPLEEMIQFDFRIFLGRWTHQPSLEDHTFEDLSASDMQESLESLLLGGGAS